MSLPSPDRSVRPSLRRDRLGHEYVGWIPAATLDVETVLGQGDLPGLPGRHRLQGRGGVFIPEVEHGVLGAQRDGPPLLDFVRCGHRNPGDVAVLVRSQARAW